MKKLIYIEENFIDPSLCQPFIDLSKRNKEEMPYGNASRGGDTFLTSVTHSNPYESPPKEPMIPETDGSYGAVYLGGNVDPTTIKLNENELFSEVINAITQKCQSFDENVVLDYVGVVRWPPGTFMKPHLDKNNIHGQDVFAAMLYLNSDFDGGCTCFSDIEVKPEPGKLLIFSNSLYLHHVTKVENNERFALSLWYKYPNQSA
jgi:hypothetical protein